ncbi:MAG: hypothetical protein KJO76_09670 [Gammaproteobacteria bacterium]|nr:hypothetical protein [Gammaproteobacteria bacterium]MBT8443688.1 hypothetical protein [Gammaproteobacteria bacterium]NND37902.1 hypothetical protein [Gammaproteobacteria bacterium]
MSTSEAAVQADADPAKYFWYLVYAVVMAVTAVPLFVELDVPQVLDRVTLLVIHEFAGFLFVGHTFFSNIWAMRIRMTMGQEAGVWARGFLRKLALSITFPMSIITPGAGLLLMAYYGGLHNNPWAWDAYLAFWLMAGVSIVPDIIRYGRNRNAGDPRHGVLSGAIRGNFGTLMVIYILWCMITKQALIAG